MVFGSSCLDIIAIVNDRMSMDLRFLKPCSVSIICTGTVALLAPYLYSWVDCELLGKFVMLKSMGTVRFEPESGNMLEYF